MERLLSVSDLMDRYQVSRQTAVRYIRKLEHLEKPYMVRESVLKAWEQSRTVNPPEVTRAEMMRRKLAKRFA